MSPDTNDFEVNAPLYYLVGRKAESDRVTLVLRITPCPTAVVSRHEDVTFAQQWAETVLLDADPVTAAEQTQRPVVVIGDGDRVEAVYADSRRVQVA